MKNKLSTFILLFLTLNCAAQVKFQRTFGIGIYNEGRCVKQTFDRGYIVAGTSSDAGPGSSDFYLVKVDSVGTFQWHNIYGGNNIDRAFSVLQTADSGYVVCGYTNSSTLNNNYDAYLVRTNQYGDTLWTKKYGGSDWDFTYSVRQTPDAGFILAGNSYSNPTGNSEAYLIKTDSLGNPEWTKSLNLTDDVFINAMALSPDGGFVLGGYKTNLIDGNQDLLVIKTNTAGDTLWTITSGTTNAEEHANGLDVSLTDSSIITCGYSKDLSTGNYDDYYVKFSPNGAILFTSMFSQPGEEMVNDVHFYNNGFIVAAYTTSFGYVPLKDFHFYTLNNTATFLPAGGTIGGVKDEIAYHVEPTSDGGFIYCGSSTSYSPGMQSLYLVKFDSLFQTTTVVIGIEEAGDKSNSPSVYPNPFHESTIIDFKDTGIQTDHSLTIFNMMGERVFTSPEFRGNKIRFFRNELPPGIYLYELNDSEKNTFRGKLVIE